MRSPNPKGRTKAPKEGERPKLTKKQEAFVEAYLKTRNATEAYRQAYDCSNMKDATIKNNAHVLLKNNDVAATVQARLEKVRQIAEDRYLVNEERVIAELAKIGFASMEDYIKVDDGGATFTLDFSKLHSAQFAAIGEIIIEDIIEGGRPKGKRTKFKLLDKRGALVDLGRYLTLFKDRVESTLNVNVAMTDARGSVSRKLSRIASAAGAGSLAQQPVAGRA